MSDERIREYKAEVAARNTDLATKGAFFVAVFAFLVLFFTFGGTKLATIVSIFYVMLSCFSAFFAQKAFGSRMKSLSEQLCIIFLMITIPYQWFFCGSFYGSGNIWFLFTAIYIMFGALDKYRNLLLTLIACEFLATVSATYVWPELTNNALLPQQQRIMCMSSLGCVGLYVLLVGVKQKLIADEVAVKIAMMQDDLTAQNEELIAVNEELIDATHRLKNANDTQRHFTASMNHELRTPLNGIEGCLQILLMGNKLDKKDTDTVKNALTSCKSITQTVNDLLDFAKLEEGKFDIIKKPFDLRDILDNVFAIFTPLASAKGLEFQIRIPRSTRVSMFGDSVRIQQVMNNLLSNAIKYTPSGKVTMSVTADSTNLIFRVADTGQGMSQNDINVLFDPFTRFNQAENVNIQGTGLGMNIVHSLITEMNGHIDVESTVGFGTIFHVSVPIMYNDSSILFSTPREDESTKNDSPLSGKKILVVDDTLLNRTIFKGLLQNDNVNITDFDSGRKAVADCEIHKYDVIILDHMMPDMDGIETMDELKAHGVNTDTPIVMLTGNKGQEYKDLYKEHGATAYIEKPILYTDLINTLSYAINKQD